MRLNIIISLLLLNTIVLFSCRKNDYYQDSGKINPEYNGTIVQYLRSKPAYFDSLAKIIDLTGYADVLSQNNITFFAPTDSSIRAAIQEASDYRESVGRTRVFKVNDISPDIWRKYLGRYIFQFSRGLNDFSQIDFFNVTSFPGQMYTSYSNKLMNIGVVYTDLVNTNAATGTTTTIKYGGYRYLAVSYLTSPFSPTEVNTWRRARVSSVNIKPSNGYVHILDMNHIFGFDEFEFAEDVAFYNN